jgi:hypothetical protein
MPTTVPKILSFLGFTGFYQQFIRGYLSIALPLTTAVKSRIVEKPNKKDLSKVVRKVQYNTFVATKEHY